MEDPEKRKERLKAMRMEAAQTDVSTSPVTSVMPGHLSNPLAETPTTLPKPDEAHGTPRFDYYTDPMSAFSGNRRNKTNQQIQRHYTSSPSSHMSSPVAQFPPSLPGPMGNAYQIPSNQGGLQAQGHYDCVTPCMGPTGMVHPSSLHNGTPREAWNDFRPPTGNFRPFQGPYMMSGPFPSYQESPEHGNWSGGQGNYNLPPNPGYAPQYSNYGHRNANWVAKTSPGSGRGRGFGRNINPNFGRYGGGRRQGFVSREHASSPAVAAERLYDKSMAEDPWQYLKPELWKSCSEASTSGSKGPAPSDSWLPELIMPKKPRVSEAPKKPTSVQQSLAEYLAASLDEATNDKSSV